MAKIKWQCRWSPSIGDLESTHQETWGTDDYTDQARPTVFFGLYGLPDFYALWRHRGERHILWAGSDILHFANGYWLDLVGNIKINPWPLAEWIQKNCTSWVENVVEQKALAMFGIKAKVTPSFLGDVKQFKRVEGSSKQAYISATGDRQIEYGFGEIEDVWAKYNPDITFHLYGAPWKTKRKNVVVHGRIPKEEMNEQIKKHGLALRLNKFDGCSEIIVKAVLMGQGVVSSIPYSFLDAKDPRKELLKIINRYPWNQK